MPIDFELGRKKYGNKSSNKKSGRYTADEFAAPAKNMLEESYCRARLRGMMLPVITEKMAEIANMSGVDCDFIPDDEFLYRFACSDEDYIEGFMFKSTDGKYCIRVTVESDEKDRQNFEFGISLIKFEGNSMESFNGESWEKANISKKLGIPEGILEKIFSDGTDKMESSALAIYCMSRKENDPPTEIGWKRFRKKNSKLINLAKNIGNVVCLSLCAEKMFIIPEDFDNTGLAIGCESGKFSVWQMITLYGMLPDEEGDPQRDAFPLYMNKVGILADADAARKFAEAHMDRNTGNGKAVTLPLSESVVLHMDEEAFTHPEKIRARAAMEDREGKYKETAEKLIKAIIIEKRRAGL